MNISIYNYYFGIRIERVSSYKQSPYWAPAGEQLPEGITYVTRGDGYPAH